MRAALVERTFHGSLECEEKKLTDVAASMPVHVGIVSWFNTV